MSGVESWAVGRPWMRWGLRAADGLSAALRRRHTAPDPGSVGRLLLIRRQAFGDLILLGPALERARELYPRAAITLMLDEAYARFLREARVPVALWSVRSWSEAARAPAGNFDVAVALRPDPRCLWLGRRHGRWLAGSGIRGGRAMLDLEVPYPRAQEAAARWVGMVEAAAGVKAGEEARLGAAIPRLRLAPEWQAAGERIWPAEAPDPVLLHPGCGTAAKRWPGERWVELGRRCGGAWPLLITGSGNERPLAEAVAAGCAGAVNLAGRTGWDGLAGLAARARAVVAPDTGVIHLARALGTPTLALFGPQPPAVWGAAGWGATRDPRHLTLAQVLPCSFCGRGRCPRLRRAPRISPCMQALGVDEVWEALVTLAGTAPRARVRSA